MTAAIAATVAVAHARAHAPSAAIAAIAALAVLAAIAALAAAACKPKYTRIAGCFAFAFAGCVACAGCFAFARVWVFLSFVRPVGILEGHAR